MDIKTEYDSSRAKMLELFFYSVIGCTVVTMVGIIAFYAYSLASMYHDTETGASVWLLGIFSDFVEIMNYSLEDSPYLSGNGSSYPPIAIAVLYPFALICKDVFAQYSDMEHLEIDEFTSLVVRHPEFWLALVLFFLISTFSIVILATRLCGLELKGSLRLAAIIPFSAPFVYAIMRGNTIYFALIFTLLFLLLYRSKSLFIRETAYVCLAIAGCIKIYPLFFGVFLLKDKKIFASLRVALYFFIIFALSFKLFPNAGNADPFIENLQGFMSDTERLSSMRNLSLVSLIYKAVYSLSPEATVGKTFETVNLLILLIIFVAATITASCTSRAFSRSIICSGMIILIPSVTYFYVLVFILIPFIEYIRSYNALTHVDRILYGSAFLFLMLTPVLLPQMYIPHVLIVISLVLAEEYKVIKNEFLPKIKGRSKVRG